MKSSSCRFYGRMNPEDVWHLFSRWDLCWWSLHRLKDCVSYETELLRQSHIWNARGPGGRDGRRGGLHEELEHAHLPLNEIYLRAGRGERLLKLGCDAAQALHQLLLRQHASADEADEHFNVLDRIQNRPESAVG